MDQRRLDRARERWRYRGAVRPDFAETPGPGQRSVWDFPRPPAIEPEPRRVEVEHAGVRLAESRRALRVCETASPPTVYLPAEDVDPGRLRLEAGSSFCEWKGVATLFCAELEGARVAGVAWSYRDPFPEFREIRGWIAFHPGRVDRCLLDGVRALPQPGRYYGGWVTPDWSGPFKGEPGSEDW